MRSLTLIVQASKLDVYASFLQNYPRAVETVRRCSAQSAQFADITRSIKLRSLQGQAQSLEDLLHRPVARVQKNALVLHVSSHIPAIFFSPLLFFLSTSDLKCTVLLKPYSSCTGAVFPMML